MKKLTLWLGLCAVMAGTVTHAENIRVTTHAKATCQKNQTQCTQAKSTGQKQQSAAQEQVKAHS